MAFLCPIFPKTKLADYEDMNSLQYLPPKKLANQHQATSFVRTVCASEVPQTQPYTRARIAATFTPTVDDEVAVQQGEFVRALYKEQDWMFVLKGDGQQGFVPAIYCQLYVQKACTSTTNIVHSLKPDVSGYSAAESNFKRNTQQPRFGRKQRTSVRKSLGRYLSKSQELSQIQERAIDVEEEDNNRIAGSTNKDSRPESKGRSQSPNAARNVHKFMDSLSDGSSNSNNSQLATPDKESTEMRQDYRTSNAEAQAQKRRENEENEPQSVGGVQSNEFPETSYGTVTMAFAFTARESDDLTVQKDQELTLLNVDDPEWTWVTDQNGLKGFVPAAYIDRNSFRPSESSQHSMCLSDGNEPDLGTELIVIEDVRGESAHDLDVLMHDWVRTAQSLQQNSWLWVYCVRTGQFGYVPSRALQAPVATVL